MNRRAAARAIFAGLLLLAAGALALPRLPGQEPPSSPSEPAPLVERRGEAGRVVYGPWYELAFTEAGPLGSEGREESAVEQLLIGLMDRSRRTLDVAIYQLDLPGVAEAMARAARRGVRVRVVTDTDTLTGPGEPRFHGAISTLRDAEIPIVGDGRRQIMHHKFTLVDGRWVQTGSWNYTSSETYRNNNHALVAESRELAANYASEFESLFGRGQFGAGKPRGVPHPSLSAAGARIETYFSPQDRGAAQVIRWIGAARQQIHFLAFAFTHDGIGDAMIERAQGGVEVAGVFEASDADSRFSEYPRLKQAGLDVILDGNPWAMHHKVIIIDGRVSIFGSFNFSASADRANDENLLIVEDVGLAAAFEEEYQRIRAEALRPA